VGGAGGIWGQHSKKWLSKKWLSRGAISIIIYIDLGQPNSVAPGPGCSEPV